MLFRGQIEEISKDKKRFRVRIPDFHKAKNSKGSTATSELTYASVATLPGCSPALKVGDAVVVGFERNDIGKPVIVGLLFNDSINNTDVDINASTLSVRTKVTLPEDTSIGKITSENIKSLLDQTSKIKDKFDTMDKHCDDSKSHITDNSIDGLKKLTLSTSLYGSVLPTNPSKGQIFFKLEGEDS